MHEHKHHSGCCGCSVGPVDRRTFLAAVGGSAASTVALSGCVTGARREGRAAAAPRVKPVRKRKPLVVQPVLTYQLYTRRDQTSWRPWGGLHTEDDVNAEIARISGELKALAARAEFPLQIRDVARVSNVDQARPLADGDADLMLIYGASADVSEMEALISPKRHNILFVRHKSGPVYLWYETAHCRLLRKTDDVLNQPGLEVEDVVVDSYDDVLWRMRACYAYNNTVGSRIVCIGGPSGWGAGGQESLRLATELWKMDLRTVSYEELAPRITAARQDADLVARAEAAAEDYLGEHGTKLETERAYVTRCFVLAEVFEDLMAEADAPAMTINNCMGAIMPIAETTACLTLSLINDAGAVALCESDFAVIPACILQHHIAQTPVFLQDPTYPHHGIITLAHCTAPRKMDGKNLEKARLMTHFESDYGAAPKVDMKVGQMVTVIDPDFLDKQWIGFRGTIQDNPFLDICRSQVDVAIEGDYRKLMRDMRGFHWTLAYGDQLRETGYALRKLGIGWHNLTDNRAIEA